MLSKQTVLNQIEVTENGTLQLRFEFKVMDEDEKVSGAWHRTSIEPGVDVSLVITSLNEVFSNMNKEPITESDTVKLQTIANAAWTPEVINSYVALKESKNEALV